MTSNIFTFLFLKLESWNFLLGDYLNNCIHYSVAYISVKKVILVLLDQSFL